MKHYFYADLPDKTRYTVFEVKHRYPYIADAMAETKARKMGMKLAGGSFNENTMPHDMSNYTIIKVRKDTKPYEHKPDGRLAKPIAEWDESEILDNEVAVAKDDEAFEGSTEDQIRESLLNWNDEFWENEWEYFLESLQEIMNTRGKGSSHWKARGINLGWTNASGHKYFEAETAKELLEAILPKTSEFTLRVYKERRGFKIKCSHHDSPTGEWYLITPVTEHTYERFA